MKTVLSQHKNSTSKSNSQREGRESMQQATSSKKSTLKNSKEGSRGSRSSNMTRRVQKTKKSPRLSDLMAAMYPGNHVGHKYCVPHITLVPKTMGWLWNSEDKITGPFPRGYQPGAISLGVKENLFRARPESEPLATPIGSKGKKSKGKRVKQGSETLVKSRSESLTTIPEKPLPPTLLVRKEKGIYRVTMQPIYPNAKEDEEPVQFKIKEDSDNSQSEVSTSSSTIKIEYLCTGARRKPIIKPEIAEISTQWDMTDIPVEEPEKKKKEINKTEEIPQDSKKKAKIATEQPIPGKEVTVNTEKTQENTEVGKVDDKKKIKDKITK